MCLIQGEQFLGDAVNLVNLRLTVHRLIDIVFCEQISNCPCDHPKRRSILVSKACTSASIPQVTSNFHPAEKSRKVVKDTIWGPALSRKLVDPRSRSSTKIGGRSSTRTPDWSAPEVGGLRLSNPPALRLI